ncbi:carboxylate--amine ligase [Actinopolyspora mortivallis]|nr:carboxylate--amine ligase [Actinopolyspora mortivallis]
MFVREEDRPTTPAGMDTSSPALVFKLDDNPLHHGGLGVIRSLGRLGVPVHAVCESRFVPAAGSRYLRGYWRWRAATASAEEVLDGLSRIARHLGRPTVVIPTDDAGAILLAEHSERVPPELLFPGSPGGLPRRMAGKDSLSELCAQYGIPTPVTETVSTWSAARSFAAEVGWPLVVKLTTPWRARGRPRPPSTSVVNDLDRLRELFERAGQPLLLQEFLPDSGHERSARDWFFHGYRGVHTDEIVGCTGVKERSYPAGAGLTSCGRWANNPELARSAAALLHDTGYRGPVDMDWRRDPRDGCYKLLDCNPRLGAQFRLFSDESGLDLATVTYLDLTGQPLPRLEGTDRRFVVENYDPLVALADRGADGPPLRERLSPLWRAEERAWFARDDLLPFGLMCLRMGWRALTRRVPFPSRQRRGRPPRFRRARATPRGPVSSGQRVGQEEHRVEGVRG